MVTIKLEGNNDFDGFDCRGNERNLCHSCRLRFQCFTDRIVEITAPTLEKYKISNLTSLVRYMLGKDYGVIINKETLRLQKNERQ